MGERLLQRRHDWTDELQTITSRVHGPVEPLAGRAPVGRRRTCGRATEQLVDDLKDLGAPDTESGEEVKSSLDSLSTTLETESGEIEDTVDGVSGITDIPSAITTITASLSRDGHGVLGDAPDDRERRRATTSSRPRSKTRPSAPTSRARETSSACVSAAPRRTRGMVNVLDDDRALADR